MIINIIIICPWCRNLYVASYIRSSKKSSSFNSKTKQFVSKQYFIRISKNVVTNISSYRV